ncbi:hypothetical protein ARMGADRAFT_222115 [Armillaria gallica]|uniref:Uncharacterized protein n=1 Tax=Armillaria gallica TaxID=47427 RepID=A0A2H3E2D6_ARMGA|nr:hypothetical protein ARMGADRAFT_222115 [Armillaria gallica]
MHPSNPVYQFCPAKNVLVDGSFRVVDAFSNDAQNLICASRVGRRFPDMGNGILSLIPVTRAARKTHSGRDYY